MKKKRHGFIGKKDEKIGLYVVTATGEDKAREEAEKRYNDIEFLKYLGSGHRKRFKRELETYKSDAYA